MLERPHESQPPPPGPGGQGPFTGFGKVIRGYAGLWTVFVAFLPAPVSLLRSIPMYEAQRGYFGLYSCVLCFLMLGYVLYTREWLVRRTSFPRTNGWTLLLPFFLIVCSITCVVLYHATLMASVEQVIDEAHRQGTNLPNNTHAVLAATDERLIPQSLLLFGLYMGMFVFAEAVFIIFAVKEYIQQTLGISEKDLLKGTASTPRPQDTHQSA